MIKIITLLIMICFTSNLKASVLNNTDKELMDTLPYYSIGEYPDTYNSANIIKRLIDGLGYRYHWATEALNEDDLSFKPSENSRTSLETLNHINSLSKTILKFFSAQAIERSKSKEDPSWEEIRLNTLNNLKGASDILASISEEDLFNLKVKFKRGERESEFAFWHIINGQISDAIYHVGQIVSNRRASGNPLSPNVSVFSGKNR